MRRGIRRGGRFVAGEPLRRVTPCVVAGGTRPRRRLRGNLKTALLWCLHEGAAMQEPLRFRRGGSHPNSRLESKYTFTDADDDRTDDLRLRRQ